MDFIECKIIDENNLELTKQRVVLVKISSILVKNGLELIGVQALQQM